MTSRALVIDDSAASRNFICSLLEGVGWEVTSAASADEGAVLALNDPPSVVISDLWMPGLSGIQLCRLLHEDAYMGKVPVVLMSATLDRRSRYWALQSGARAAIEKRDIAQLPELLQSMLPPDGSSGAPSRTRQFTKEAIPVRLSQLLDDALFESLVARELRSLASSANIQSFFNGLVLLLGQVVGYQWLGLRVHAGTDALGFFHVAPDRRDDALAEAAHRLTIELTPDDAEAPFVLCDERCDAVAGQRVETYPILNGDVEVGRLALSFNPSPKSDDHALLQFIASELALSLRCVVLAEETRRIASTDTLTGLHNRRSGLDVLTQSTAAAARYGQPFSVALLDLDHFKRVNDEHGHNVGDAALRHLAKVLKRATRKADFPMRWGGEEFVLLMPSTGAAGARVCAERIRMAVATAPLLLEDGKALPLTVSIGVATFDGRESETDLIERADKALYAAKGRGRNRVETS